MFVCLVHTLSDSATRAEDVYQHTLMAVRLFSLGLLLVLERKTPLAFDKAPGNEL